VINYDMPQTIDDYVHRIGRTGRVGHEGVATTFFNSSGNRLAAEIVQILEEQGQPVEEWLLQAANENPAGPRKVFAPKERSGGFQDRKRDGFSSSNAPSSGGVWGEEAPASGDGAWGEEKKSGGDSWGEGGGGDGGRAWGEEVNKGEESTAKGGGSWGESTPAKSSSGGWGEETTSKKASGGSGGWGEETAPPSKSGGSWDSEPAATTKSSGGWGNDDVPSASGDGGGW